MYIWVAVDIDSQLAGIRKKVTEISKKLSSDNSAITLPLHISLRISFPVNNPGFTAVVRRINNYYKTLKPFEIKTNCIEKANRDIIWISMKESGELSRIHSDMVDFLKAEFDIEPHFIDSTFLFHSTLFFDSDAAKANKAYEFLKNTPIPDTLIASKFLIGCSETGLPGSYRVISEQFV